MPRLVAKLGCCDVYQFQCSSISCSNCLSALKVATFADGIFEDTVVFECEFDEMLCADESLQALSQIVEAIIMAVVETGFINGSYESLV